VHLADFGSSVQLQGREGTANEHVGTMGFFAPEIVKKEPYGTAVDVYSLGCVLYTLLTGCAIFSSDC